MSDKPTKEQVALKIKCEECGNPVRSNGIICEKATLCGKCMTTPPEIRSREIHGCLSNHMMTTPAQVSASVAEKERQDAFADTKIMSADAFRRKNIRPAPRPEGA